MGFRRAGGSATSQRTTAVAEGASAPGEHLWVSGLFCHVYSLIGFLNHSHGFWATDLVGLLLPRLCAICIQYVFFFFLHHPRKAAWMCVTLFNWAWKIWPSPGPQRVKPVAEMRKRASRGSEVFLFLPICLWRRVLTGGEKTPTFMKFKDYINGQSYTKKRISNFTGAPITESTLGTYFSC